jgi:CspA family cold shock protein
MPVRCRGRIKWFNPTKGYGFIIRDDGERDVYVHYTQFLGRRDYTLIKADYVEFDVVEGLKGPQAHKIVLLEAV